MEIKKPIVPDFDKCCSVYNWNKNTTYKIANNLNDVYELKIKVSGVKYLRAR